ncbi:nitroreductase family protein [Oceanivirga salmonicida]|uniref:nitroreductase family protein n=1 Tax=Oceanivirga salmonicida TaxID=1769291 RepID=UPI000831AA01|nr:nitroreductase family protein [Oceanivirga salmonicida]
MKVLEAIKNRQSVRKFKDEEVLEKDLKEIFELATKSPSAYNSQSTSIVYTKDKEKISKIAKLCGGQPQVENAKVFILIITDLYRANTTLNKKGVEMVDSSLLLNKFAVDAGIMTYLLNIAATAKGYGCTIIGGVNNDPENLAKLFDLPEHTKIAIGLTLGVPENSNMLELNTKPKLPSEVLVMEDKYNKGIQENALFDYEKELDNWFKKINVNQPMFTDVLANIFAKKEGK